MGKPWTSRSRCLSSSLNVDDVWNVSSSRMAEILNIFQNIFPVVGLHCISATVYELLLTFIDLLHVSFTFILVLFYVAPPFVQSTVKLK